MNQEIVAHLPPNPNIAQQAAADPESIVWVSASAGSGKTKVLTDRVLRLLLPDPQGRWAGAAPHTLLCITYTKAAAAEMALRVNEQLGRWAVEDESKLVVELAKLIGETPQASLIAASRKLFADVLDCPGGLKILTIHAFCQSVLGRFPLEAGVNPTFTVLDDQMSDEILSQVLNTILLRAQNNQQADLAESFRRLAVILQLDDLIKHIRQVLKNPDALENLFEQQQDLNSLETDIQAGLGLKPGLTEELLQADFIKATPETILRNLIKLLAEGEGKTTQDVGLKMQAWLDLPASEKSDKFEDYFLALLTKTGTPRVLKKFEATHPDDAEIFHQECDRILIHQDQLAGLRQARQTAALLILSKAALQGYEDEKRHRDGLDYHDLIRKTDALLQSTSAQWVHFKLDGGINHILMDEAQDTNPHQWNILKHLSSEIFDGLGRETQAPRSLFVVGDKKQSIFSFQGADPKAFDRMQAYFADKAAAASRELKQIPLEVSFRSARPVLNLVDEVFTPPELRGQIGYHSGEKMTHHSYFPQNAGLVELWPLIPKIKKKKSDEWELPFSAAEDVAAQASLAENIAQEISFWLQKGETLESQGRAITPGDILILVRTRTSLVHELVRQLKRRNIAVSGIDRLKLGDQIGVQDLLAVAKFVRLPADEFSLACVLKSPLVGMSEEDLMALALGRPEGLWETLQTRDPSGVAAWLGQLVELGHSASPFEFLEAILNRACPADPDGTGWRAMTRRLGNDVIDPLEELISLCLKLEPQGVRTLEDLILWQQKTEIEIKREMEEAGGQVRIMTVHASKGLEAPIVILPDTTSVTNRGRLDKFLWPDQSDLDVPIWSARSADSCARYTQIQDMRLLEQQAESARLLYVALTRARDRLYVMGAEGNSVNAVTWYSLVQEAFARLDGVIELENGRRRIASPQSAAAVDRTKENKASMAATTAPAWLLHPPQPEPVKPRPFTPSRTEESYNSLASGQIHSPNDAAHPHRFKRGIITHKLFQFLPDLPESRREAAAAYYISRAGRDLPDAVRLSILEETFQILNDPEFAAVFGKNSLAEVPVTGALPDGRIISGQIDRLIIENDKILIIDYKTNRPSPRSAGDIPDIYRSQLQAYHDALAAIYPKSLIKCALLWTDQPLLMPVPIS